MQQQAMSQLMTDVAGLTRRRMLLIEDDDAFGTGEDGRGRQFGLVIALKELDRLAQTGYVQLKGEQAGQADDGDVQMGCQAVGVKKPYPAT